MRISCRQREGCSLNIRRNSTLATAPIYYTHTDTHITNTHTHTHTCVSREVESICHKNVCESGLLHTIVAQLIEEPLALRPHYFEA